MKKNIIVNPVGLKGHEINERMMELMGIKPINENKNNISVELTKIGPDGKAYAIVRENHEWYIKRADKTNNLIAEDFKYIGGLQNKKLEAYSSYAKAIKHLNLKFRSLAEAYNYDGEINVFKNDNLLTEAGIVGFSEMKGHGFAPKENMEEAKEGKTKKAGREFVGKEISHLEKDKDYSHDRAVAASLNIARKKGYPVEEEVEMEDYEKAIDEMLTREDNSDDLIGYDVPEWALGSLINGDDSNLEDEDIEKLNRFVDKVVRENGNANFMLGDIDGKDNLGFQRSNDIDSLGGNVYRVYIKPSNKTIDERKNKSKFPDLTGDGKVTYADILKGRGVDLKETVKKKLNR